MKLMNFNHLTGKERIRTQHIDDERSIGNSIIISLWAGWQFGTDPFEARHVEGFDTIREAKEGIREAVKCNCEQCKEEKAEQARQVAPLAKALTI